MSSVIGFDVGAKTCFVATAKAGGIETIPNEYSSRSTPAYVSFGEQQRSLGTSAQQKLVMNLQSTAWLFKHLVGRPFDDEVVRKYQALLPYQLVEVPETKKVGIKVNHAGNDYTFGMEQILAMLLGKLKGIASAGLDNREVRDCVVAVPFYLTNAERCAWLQATEIAGLNPLRLMNETTAIALSYGLFKNDLPEPSEKSRTVAFVDIGYTHTQVAVVQFNKGQLKVIAVSSDRNLGGHDFDLVLVKHFTEEFKTKYKMDVSSKKRAELRLYNECEKLKKLMSANATEMTMNVECIMDDKDVTGRMKRETFEELCKERGFIEKFENCLKDCKGQLKEGVAIDSVEMVGGSCRVPFIKESITKVFEMTPSTTLNSDEAVSRGAALQCAILSPALKVREFNIIDVQPHEIRIDWKGSDGKAGEALLFQKNEAVPISKVLTFSRKNLDNFEVVASYNGEKFSAFPDRLIGNYTVGSLKEPETPNADGSMKIKVKLRIDSNGLLVMPQAVQIDKKETEEEIKEDPKPMPDPTADPKPEEPTEDKPKEEAPKQPEETKPKTKTVLKNIKIELSVLSNINQKLSDVTLQNYVQTENELAVLDKKERDRQDARNKVEEFVYESRDKLYAEYSEFAEDVEKENISSSLTSAEDWLYDEEDRAKSAYLEKYDELKSLLGPIHQRAVEFNSRQGAIDGLLTYIKKVEKFVARFNDSDVELVHIDKEKVTLVEKNLKEVQAWTNSATVKVSQMKKTANPEVLSSEFAQKHRELNLASESVMNTPKPKKEEPKKEEEKKSTEEKASAEAGNKDEDMSAGDASNSPNSKPEAAQQSAPVADDMQLD